MKVQFNVNPACTLDYEAKDIKTAFSFIAYAQSVFGIKRCGNCESPNLRLQHRQPQGYDYYSVKCDDCGHELKFGQQKEGGKLFPKGWEAPYEKSEGSSSDEREPVGAGSNGRNDDIDF